MHPLLYVVMDRRDATRRVTYSAVCTAIAVSVILISQFSPMRIVPLILASLAFYIAFVRCGVIYGAVTVAVSVIICFFVSGITTTFLFLCIVFAPYALIAFFMRKLSYRVMWQAVVRLAVTAAFFAVCFVVMVLLVDYIAGTSLMALIEKIGKVWAGVIIVVAALPVDFFFCYASDRIIKLLK